MIINVNSNLFMYTAFFKVILRFLHEIRYTKVGKNFIIERKKSTLLKERGLCLYG